MLKTRFPFLYASTSLDTKTLTIASNRNFESCMSNRCLAPQHILRFFPFLSQIFPLPLATLIIIVSSSSTLHWAIQIKKTCLQWVTFPGKSSSIVTDAKRSRCLDSFRRELFTNLYESRIWFWETHNHFERIYKVYIFDWFSSNFAKHCKNNNKRKYVGKFWY